jgi:ribosome biogenesis GTPase / thiamine phosphate phosphatase
LSHLARVAAVHRGGLELITDAGPRAGFITGRLRHAAAAAVDLPAVGDRVAFDPESGAVHAVLERRSALVRAARDGREPQVLAANVDLVVVVASLTRELSLGRIQRMLTLAADAPADALVVLSKADLDPDPAARVAEVRAALAGAAPVLPVSTVDGTGLDAVAALLGPGVTGVLLGASGVGKTTLLNALAGGERSTGPIRAADDRGRHTTTWRELVPLAGGGTIIDTPGLKLPRIWEQAGGLASVFSDVEELARGCRFAGCRHAGEPGCAVAAALDDGTLAPERLAAHEQLGREQAWAESRRDERARRERKDATRRLHREQRRIQRATGGGR